MWEETQHAISRSLEERRHGTTSTEMLEDSPL
jgi:hypothetical protein